MRKTALKLAVWGLIAGLLPALLQSCTGGEPTATVPAESEVAVEGAATTAATAEASEAGTLEIRANGEDFVRQGFTSKDGWEISFDHVYATLAEVTAYQTEPAFDPDASSSLNAQAQVSLPQPVTVDLAEGDASAEPVKVGEVAAPKGRYNALSWKLVSAPEGPAEGYPLYLQGTATKDGQTLPFTLKLSEELMFTCGEFVGDERKGILTDSDTADLEATFHFDHLFGDGEAPADDDINTGALGFDPLAALAQNGQVDVDSATLKEQLSEADYQTLMGILPSLGHVGEGHCEASDLTT